LDETIGVILYCDRSGLDIVDWLL